MQNANSGANVVAVEKFDDFKLHLEFRVPNGADSGVYLRGRYELEIVSLEPSSHHLGGVYGFIAPSETPPALPASRNRWMSRWPAGCSRTS